MTDSTINLIWVILFRAAQTVLDSGPTLLCGLFAAGLMRGMIGPEALRRWFATDVRVGPIRAWLTGLLLPVCSFGILPIAWELKRAKVPRACVLTLLLSAPLANPFTLVYAFQRMEGVGPWGFAAIALLLVGSFIVTVGLGELLGRFLPETIVFDELPPIPASPTRRVALVAMTVARGLVGELLVFLLIGAFGSGLLGAIPGGALERAVNDRSVWSPFHVAWVSVLFQTPPARGMVLICESFISGVSLGKAFVFLMLGVGIHLGTLVWIAWSYGFRVFSFAIPFLIAGSLAIGFALPVAIPTYTNDSDRDCHFLEIEATGGQKVAQARAIRTTLTNDAGELQWFMVGASAIIAGFWVVGLVSTFLGERGSLSHMTARDAPKESTRTATTWSVPISRHQQTVAGVLLTLIFVLTGLYIYYPAPRDLFTQMDEVQTELAVAFKSDPIPRRKAIYLANQWKRLQNKLIVSDLLRQGRVDPSVRASSVKLNSAIDRLRTTIVGMGSTSELKPLFVESQQAADECRQTVERGSAGIPPGKPNR